MNASSTTRPKVRKQLSSSILLWVRTDQPRQSGMDYWKGPHSGIISANPGLKEYRQIHLAEDNPGRWPATDSVSRPPSPPTARSTASRMSPSRACSPRCRAASRTPWRTRTRSTCSAAPCSTPGSRARPVGTTSPPRASRSALARSSTCAAAMASAARAFRTFVNKQLVSVAGRDRCAEGAAHADVPALEPEAVGHPRTWPTTTPMTSASTPRSCSGSSMTQRATRSSPADAVKDLSEQLTPIDSAVHAYDVTAALTYVKDGHVLPHYEA